jgi:integrase/recombinase XerD
MKPTITLKPLQHRGAELIGIYFKNNSAINILIRSKGGGKWSQTNKCWHIPLTREAFNNLNIVLKEHASIDYGDLKRYLEEKKKPAEKERLLVQKSALPTSVSQPGHIKVSATISAINKHVLPAMTQLLKLKAFSPSYYTYLPE